MTREAHRIVKNLFVSKARSGAAVLMSIHLLAIAEELADTIGIVDQGRMLTVGTLAELREQAQHRRLSRRPFLEADGQGQPAGEPAASATAWKREMSLAIREPIVLPDLVPDRTAQALRRLRLWQIRNTLGTMVRGSRLRIAMILFCSLVFWVGLFVLFLGGFQFVGLYVDLANTIVEYLFSMFFLSLLVMLFFSTGIIVYTSLFHSREAAFLLTTPASTDRIFAYKFAEAAGFSSWGFFLLGSPLMVAYGLTSRAPAAFYWMFLLYLFSFVLIPGGLGAVAAIVVANIFPRRQKTVLTAVDRGGPGTGRLRGVSPLADSGRRDEQRLAGGHAQPPGLLPEPALAQPLDVGRPARRGQGQGSIAPRGLPPLSIAYYLMYLSAHAGLAYLLAAVLARDFTAAAIAVSRGGGRRGGRAGSCSWIPHCTRSSGSCPGPSGS